MEACLKLASKIRADKRTKVPTDPTLAFEVFSMPQSLDENFNIHQRLSSAFFAPVYETYSKTLARRLKNFTSEDASSLLKLVLSVLIVPVSQNPSMTAKFFENDSKLLHRLFSPYLSSANITATIIGYRDRDFHVLEEMRHEIELTQGQHPLYPKQDFINTEAFESWRAYRLSDLSHKQKLLEKQPEFTGRLAVTVLQATGLNENNDKSDTSSIYYIVKVAEKESRSEQYVANSWSPVFQPETFSFDVPARDCRIKIELWDKNFIGSSFLGCVMAKPSDLMWSDQPVERFWPLGSRTRSKDVGITGKLLVRFNLSFSIGPYRPPSATTASKSAFSSLFSPSSSTPSSPSSKSVNSPATNHNSDLDGFGASKRAAKDNSTLSTSSDSDVLPAPPPIINSHMNNYPEWYSSLLMIALQDALNNPPPKNPAHFSDSSSTGSDTGSGKLSATTPPIPYGVNSGMQSPISQTPNRPSPTPTSYLTPHASRSEKRSSREMPFGGDLSSAFAMAAGEGERHEFTSNGLWAPVPSRNSGNLSTNGAANFVAAYTSAKALGPLSESPKDGVLLNRSTSDLLTSSSGSLSRSAPQIRSSTPIRRSAQPSRSGVSNSTGSIDEEVENPVKYGEEVHWLLDRFVERFNIDPCFSPLLNIELLDSSFNTKSSIHMDALYSSLVEFESARAISPLRWQRVQQLYEFVVCEALKNRLDDALCNYFYRFPRNEPKGALSQTILLYSMITKSDIQQLSVILNDKLESAMMKMYKVTVGEKFTENSLLDATRFVMQAVEQDLKYFNDVFPADLMLGALSMRTYYTELLSKNVKAWLRPSPPISDLTMVLYSYLNKLHSQLTRAQCGFDLLPLATLFQPFVGKWIEHIGETLPPWCRYDLLRKETWKSVSNSSGSHSSESILHATSVQILFEGLQRVYTQYRQFDMRTAKDLKQLIKIFAQTVAAYMQVMATKAVELFVVQGAPRGVTIGGGRNSPSLRHTASSRFRTGSSGDVYALASSSSENLNISAASATTTATSASPHVPLSALPSKFGNSSLSFWTSFGITPSSLNGSTSGSSSRNGANNGSSSSSKLAAEGKLFHVPIESCVWISTLDTLSQKLYDVCKQLVSDSEKGSEDVRGWLSDTFSQVQQLQTQLFSLIIKLINTNPSLELALDSLFGHSTDVDKITDAEVSLRLEPLFDYINSRVEVLSANLDYKVFLKLLEHIWLMIVKDIEILAFPAIGDRKAEAKKAHFVEYALPFIISFFEGKDGEGLSKAFLEGESVILRTCFTMLKVPTGVLCKAYNDILNGLAPNGISGSEDVDALTLEQRIISVLSMRKNDKEAKKFVKANRFNTINRATLRAFDLPKGETVVDYFTCRKGKDSNVSGYLYVTTNWICFDTYLWGDHMTTIPLNEIRSVKRKKTTLSTNGITIRLRDGATTINFSALNKIKAYDVIVEQAEKQGCVLETYDKHVGGATASQPPAITLSSSSTTVPYTISSSIQNASPMKRSGSQHREREKSWEVWTDDFFDEAIGIAGAKRIENEEDVRSNFGLGKNDEAIVALDCALVIENAKESHRSSSSSSTPTTAQIGTLYCFTKCACFRGPVHKIIIQWNHVNNLGQKGTDGILVISKEKKKSKQYCFTKFQAPDDVFTLLHSIWGKARG